MSENTQKMMELYNNGLSYRAIAKELQISENTAKSFCRRQAVKITCKQCGTPVKQNPGRKKKEFCSDKCRLTWWNSHREKVNRQAYYTLICKCCNKEFQSYSDPNRLFCSRKCYLAARGAYDGK